MSADQKHSKTQPSRETGHGVFSTVQELTMLMSISPVGLPVGLVHRVPKVCQKFGT